jgi:hypothetical protein
VAEVCEDHDVPARVMGLHDLILRAIDAPASMQVPREDEAEDETAVPAPAVSGSEPGAGADAPAPPANEPEGGNT